MDSDTKAAVKDLVLIPVILGTGVILMFTLLEWITGDKIQPGGGE